MRLIEKCGSDRRSCAGSWSTAVAVIGGVMGMGVAPPPTAHAAIAVEVAFGAFDEIFPNVGTTHGWQFSVNVPMEVTHLGLYDRFQDGFVVPHPIGLWDGEGNLLAEDIIESGTSAFLVENFRYVDITEGESDGGVILTPGSLYTIGFFTGILSPEEGMVVFDGSHTVNPAVEYVGFGVNDFTSGLEIPMTRDEFGAHRWGPNFQFNVVPAPSGALGLGLILIGRRRRRLA